MDSSVRVGERSVQKELYFRHTPVLKYSIRYPQISSLAFSSFAQKLNSVYRQKALRLAEYCETDLYLQAIQTLCDAQENGFPFREYTYNLDYTVTYNAGCALSLYFDEGRYTGGANGMTARESDNWKMDCGMAMTLEDVFCDESDVDSAVKAAIIMQINRQIANGEYYFENYPQLVNQFFEPKNFYLTDAGVALFFQAITIAPHSSGIPVFTIPYVAGPIRPKCK